MTPERFAEIVEAYGSRSSRWPRAEREAALAFMASHPDAVGELRADASLLDGMLDSSVVAPASAGLRQAILQAAPIRQAAPALRVGARPKPTLWQRAGVWGAGIVGIGLAGALAGAMTLAIVVPMMGATYDEGDVHNLTAFNDPLPTVDEQTVDE